MVDALRQRGAVSGAVERALRDVPRHLFLPDVDVEDAYVDEAVAVKSLDDGTLISSASQPSMVAAMLELLDVQAGHRVLEIGTGTGYNAALLGLLVGREGSVVTLELEDDLVLRARQVLSDLSADQVQVVPGDGGAGHPGLAPYDRVIVTVGAPAVSQAWSDQLRDGGRLVVPVVSRSGTGSVVEFDKVGGSLVRRSEIPCRFVPMRGVGWA